MIDENGGQQGENINSDGFVDEEYICCIATYVSEPIHLTEELKNRIAAAGRASLTAFLSLSDQKMYAVYIFIICFLYISICNMIMFSYHCYCIGKFKILASNYSYLYSSTYYDPHCIKIFQ